MIFFIVVVVYFIENIHSCLKLLNLLNESSILSLYLFFVFNNTCKIYLSSDINTLENHCIRTAQSSRGGCSRRVYKIMYIAVKKGNIFVIFLLLKILIANYNHIHPAVYLLNNFCGLSDSHYSARVMPKM